MSVRAEQTTAGHTGSACDSADGDSWGNTAESGYIVRKRRTEGEDSRTALPPAGEPMHDRGVQTKSPIPGTHNKSRRRCHRT